MGNVTPAVPPSTDPRPDIRCLPEVRSEALEIAARATEIAEELFRLAGRWTELERQVGQLVLDPHDGVPLVPERLVGVMSGELRSEHGLVLTRDALLAAGEAVELATGAGEPVRPYSPEELRERLALFAGSTDPDAENRRLRMALEVIGAVGGEGLKTETPGPTPSRGSCEPTGPLDGCSCPGCRTLLPLLLAGDLPTAVEMIEQTGEGDWDNDLLALANKASATAGVEDNGAVDAKWQTIFDQIRELPGGRDAAFAADLNRGAKLCVGTRQGIGYGAALLVRQLRRRYELASA